MTYLNRIMIRLMLIFAFAAVGLGQEAIQKTPAKQASKGNSHIATKYNKSKNQTTVSLKTLALTGLREERPQIQDVPKHQMDLDVSFTYPGQQFAKQAETVAFHFRVTARTYIFLRGQPVMAVLDKNVQDKGRVVQLGTTDYNSSLKFNTVYEEFLALSIPFEALEKVTRGQTVDIYVGPVGYTLKENQIQDLRDFGSLMIP